MGALESNTTLVYGVHIRESANDGSDFTNAATDYRIAFIGEDGAWHLKDSAGTVTSPGVPAGAITSSGLTMATARLLGRTTASTGAVEEITVGTDLSLSAGSLTATAASVTGDRVIRTAGDVAITGNTNYNDVTGMSLSVTTGAHRVLIGVIATGYVNNGAGTASLDIDLDGARLGTTTFGLSLNLQHATASETMNYSFTYMTAALSAASHTFKLQARVGNSGHTFTINANDPPCVLWVAELPY